MTGTRLGPPGTTRWAAAIGVAGLALVGVGLVLEPAQAAFSYLAAYLSVLALALGALILLMIEHLIAATWFVAFRRTAEAVLGAIPLLAVLFLPIALRAASLYIWMDPSRLDAHARAIVERKAAYLNLPFFFVRAGVYFASWIALAELVRRWSLRQDRDPGEHWTRRQRTLAGPGLIVLAFTLTFAAFDWIMSLAPTWYSTIFGVQIFAGGMVGAVALIAVLAGIDARGPELRAAITPDHYSAVGKLLLTFVIFWAYASFAQLLIIWIGDLPEEVTWYLPRLNGSWLWVAVAIALGHFAVPFVVLLSYHAKRSARVLVPLGIWLLAMDYLEAYWIVLPQLHPTSAAPHWLDAAAVAGVAGTAFAYASWRARAVPALPLGDPELSASLHYSES